MRYLLVDKVLELEKGKRIAAVKCATMGEPFLRGLRTYPPALILEAIVQAGGLLCRASANFERMSVLGKVESALFPAPVRAGDRMRLEAKVVLARPDGNLCEGVATVDGRVVGQASFLLPFLPPEMEPAGDRNAKGRRARLAKALGLRIAEANATPEAAEPAAESEET